MTPKVSAIRLFIVALVAICFAAPLAAAEFASDWTSQHDRVWIGPRYWSNPMEDWRLRDGRLECIRSGQNRNVHLLTHQIELPDVAEQTVLETSVALGLQSDSSGNGSAGFELGVRSELGDYRSSLIRGRGVRVGITSSGTAFIQAPGNAGEVKTDQQDVSSLLNGDGLRLELQVRRVDDDAILSLVVKTSSGEDIGEIEASVPAGRLNGNMALIQNVPGVDGQQAKFWFQDWMAGGPALVEHPEREFGPILYSMYTLSRDVMKMTAQMPPLGPDDDQVVRLQVPAKVAAQLHRVADPEPPVPSSETAESRRSDVRWATLARATIDPHSRTAHFRIARWPDHRDVPYRLAYTMTTAEGDATEHYWGGTIRRDPIDRDSISVAGFTGHKDTAFPNELLVSNVKKHNPDLLLFTGDQIYEDAGGYGIIREPQADAIVNYLRKIYLWGWSFRDVLRDRPSLVLPDDHDVYQGNIWGQGGKPVPGGIRDHDQGGFAQHADFVNAVFRTQVGHHPDAYDPTPMLQGIDVWFGDMVYGGVSFAIIEDRYFKSGPADKVNAWEGRPDHVKDPDYDMELLDKPGLVMLGERQLEFLNKWAQDWRGAKMKCVCSQTIFANVANYHGPRQEYIHADLDSNGWPQTPRDEAVDAMRRGFAFHYAGDQHLPSIVQYGIDEWRDANYAFCVPSTAAGYPRSWLPDREGRPVRNRPEPGLPNTGDYFDGLNNLVTVYAIGNPEPEQRKPVLELLHDKASGYGLVHFNKPERTIRMECWKLIFDADDPQPDDQFPGWPMTIEMRDNYGREAVGHLPTLEIENAVEPVVQVIREDSGEVLYTLRIAGNRFRPKVFRLGTHTVRITDDRTGRTSVLLGLSPAEAADRSLHVELK